MRKQILGCLGVILVLALTVSLVINVILSGLLGGRGTGEARPPDRFDETLVQAPAGGDADKAARVAQIDITGIITNDSFLGGESMVSRTKRALQQALDDRRVKAIVLRIDSPGGEVTASDTIYHAVKQAAAKKPVIACMDSIAASGGYYIACGAKKIVANENTWTGSIGVIVQTLGYNGLLEKTGLSMRVFRSGSFKDTFGGHRPLTQDEEKYIQDMVMQTYDRFTAIVAAARNLPVETLRTGIADGRIVSGADAVKLKLVDRTGYIEDAWQLAREEAGLTDSSVVSYARSSGFNLLSLLTQIKENASSTQRLEIDLSDRLLPRLQPGRVYLLPEFMAQ
ncbi:MAG TPA: signal peptide peptidase SppA [Verrucomicrobiales bacterium]|nr:signal peptide peptidase SppA [Verrucomicrobiales bacterium]